MEDMHVNLDGGTDENRHECRSQRHGDWIVFTCGQCPGYERRVNWRTGKMSVRNSSPDVSHSGYHLPPELLYSFQYVN